MPWQGGRTVGALRGKRLRFKFYLSNAALYSFSKNIGSQGATTS